MEEELDLGPYLKALRRSWYLPIAGLVGAILVVVALSLLQGRHYAATATVAVPLSRYQWRIATGIQATTDATRKDPREATLESITAPEITRKVADALGAEAGTGEDVRAGLKVREVPPDLLSVQVSADDPGQAAARANAWADAVATTAIQEVKDSLDLDRFRAELDVYSQQLAAADLTYERIRAESGLELRMGGTLAATDDRLYAGDALGKTELILDIARLGEYRQAIRYLQVLTQSVERARGAGESPESLPFELLDTPLLRMRGTVRPEELRTIASWDQLLARLRNEAASLADTEASLAEAVASQQTRLAQQYTDLGRVERERGILLETVNNLRRKVEELAIQARVDTAGIRVVSYASPPTRPAWTSRLVLMALAGLLGLGLGILTVIVRTAMRPGHLTQA